ncbi:M23 family metallopeptidase [uncultured Ruminococcus sp.]|uniref:M23 family metallopeptidase n=1 Tax=uncultured Ruminococcus sp. TaxID=165186 RepID=UPI0025E9A9E5|nr:M23 family metallopeptidase [uncultured Ruminococcus sp.]
MKKNELTDKYYGKGSKGFYAALGISAVMIGAACLFAHKQGDRITQVKPSAEKNSIVHEAAVDKRVTNIPKTTAAHASPVTTAATAPKITEIPQQTIPAAEITVDAPFSDNSFNEQAQPAAADLSGAAAPLADIGNILSEFSNGELVKNATTGTWQTHNGTDIAAEVGADVYAIADGEIRSVTNDPLWGVSVVVDHNNGYISKYRGLGADLAVKQDDKVSRGEIIGCVGETADIESSLAPHLHIEVIHDGKFIDPMSVTSCN